MRIFYVISHKSKEEKGLGEIFGDMKKSDNLYLKGRIVYVRGEKHRAYTWVDIFEADRFNSYDEAAAIVKTMPFQHIIEKVEIEEVEKNTAA